MAEAQLSKIPGRICWWLVMWLYPALPFNNAIRAKAMFWAHDPFSGGEAG